MNTFRAVKSSKDYFSIFHVIIGISAPVLAGWAAVSDQFAHRNSTVNVVFSSASFNGGQLRTLR